MNIYLMSCLIAIMVIAIYYVILIMLNNAIAKEDLKYEGSNICKSK